MASTTNVMLNSKAPAKKESEFYVFQKAPKKDFTRITGAETHLLRRQMILKAHPQVQNLMTSKSNLTYYLTVGIVALQLLVAYLIQNTSWPTFLIITYVVGGTLGHVSHVLIHDLTHFAGNQNMNMNRIFAIINNMSIGLPSAISFGKYHADHHNFLGEEGRDPDLPLKYEAEMINTKTKKIMYYLSIVYVYALRPLFFYPLPVNRYEIVNYIVIIGYDVLIYVFMGPTVLAYILICSYLSIGPHPTALHIIAEHYEFVHALETYDYIGWMNILTLNMGYHQEHHDFPTIPWYNLPKLRAMAPEFYEHLPHHTSYFQMLYKFIMDDNFGLFYRTIRSNPKNIT